MKANNTQIVNRGIGGCCDKYNVDSIEVNGVVIAVRFTRWDNESRKYYEIPVSVKNQAAVIAAFPELDITEDEPGAILLRNADDETTVKVGMFAAELDGELTPEPTNTDNNNNPENNTPSTMNANKTISAAIIAELNTRKDRSAWNKGVTEYATELAESLDNWDKQPESVAELREMMLNGAGDWKAYSWGGLSLIYNQDIAERLCSPSELKRVTNKSGLRDYPNSREHWLDVQARALYQAANRVAEIANKFFNA